jgi:surface protein
MDGVVNNSVMIVLTLILSKVFRASSDGGSFNANVSAWDVSKVTSMQNSKYSQLTTNFQHSNLMKSDELYVTSTNSVLWTDSLPP